jgi:hypothetical protein
METIWLVVMKDPYENPKAFKNEKDAEDFLNDTPRAAYMCRTTVRPYYRR